MPKVFIIVLNFNGKKDTLDCLESLKKLAVKDYSLEVLVVDNGSTDGSVKAVKKFLTSQSKLKIHLIENRENLGFAQGNNVGIKAALDKGADFVLILNNDTAVDKSLVVELLKAAEGNKKAGVFGPKIYFSPGFEYHKKRYRKKDLGKVIWYAGGKIDWANVLFSHRGVDEVDRGQYDQTRETDYISGCAMFVRKKVFDQIGLFDQRYFAYLEDADFCQRAEKKDWKMIFVPGAVAWHKVSQTAGGIGSEIQDYYITRNRLLFAFRFASLRTKLALIRESFSFLFSHPQKRKAVVDFYLGRFGRADV